MMPTESTQSTEPIAAAVPSPGYTTVELLTLSGPEYRRVSRAPPRPATADEIPVIDLGGGGGGGGDSEGEKKKKEKTAAAIREAATGSGFFYVRNHGIPEAVVGRALEAAKAFFAQDEEAKMRVWNRKTSSRNGYCPLGSSQINRSETKGS